MSDREFLPKISKSQYSKAFEAYWNRTDHHVGNIEPWQSSRIKRLAFNAWKAGRKQKDVK